MKTVSFVFFCFVLFWAMVSFSKKLPPIQKSFVMPLSKKFKTNQSFAFVLPNMKPIAGIGNFRAETCGKCHKTIYNEWKKSTHSTALQDMQFLAEISKPSSPKWLCLNCHIPLENQRKNKVIGLLNGDVLKPVTLPNPHFDPKLQKESITCATCHVRNNKDGKSVIIGKRGSKWAPHPVEVRPHFLRNVCNRCHDPQGDRLTKHLVCWFQTKKEHQNSRFLGKKDCVSCHMPATQRRLVATFLHLPIRKTHRHLWVGGGIPKWFSDYQHLEKRGYRSGLDVKMNRFQKSKSHLSFALELENKRAGHSLPTGDPERFLQIEAKILNEQEKILSRKKYRIGQVWEWEPMARKISDNRLKAHEKRQLFFQLPIPPSTKIWKLEITVLHVRLSSNTMKYIKKHAVLAESFLPGGNAKKAQMEKIYPSATFLYKTTIKFPSQTKKTWTLRQLLRLSLEEKKKPLHKREY